MKNGPYNLIVAPNSYPGVKYRGRYIYEHTLVWWEHLNALPPPGWVIHHINGDKRDNRIENLSILSRAAHTNLHRKGKELIAMKCAYCGKCILKEARKIRSQAKQGTSRTYCSRSHQVKQMWRDGIAFGGKYHNREWDRLLSDNM